MKKIALFLFFCVVFILCIITWTASPTSLFNIGGCTEDYEIKSYQHEVIGFYPHYRSGTLPIEDISFDKLTRIIYAFVIPQSDGTINTDNLFEIDQLVTKAHQQGVEVYVSVGGANCEHFPTLAQHSGYRRRFVEQITDFAIDHCLDGVDIDWEFWNKDEAGQPLESERQALVSLLADLRQRFTPLKLGLSIDVPPSDWRGRFMKDAVVELVDQVHVMAYDFTGPWEKRAGQHASFEQSIGRNTHNESTGLAYWHHYRSWDKQKLYLGVPFYGRDFDNNGGQSIHYKDIISQFPKASYSNQVKNIYFNGKSIIRQKSKFVVNNDYPGIMIWELGQDAKGASSLLNEIDAVLN